MSLAVWIVAALAGAAGGQSYENDVRPLLAKHCYACHSTAKQEGELDLERFTSLVEIRKRPAVWQNVLEQLETNEMPPKASPQPTAPEKTRLVAWVRATLDDIALARAGDPGPVVLRRLSNSEYAYTIRDLTGVASLDPTQEFPVDGAAGEGFTNAGAALVMSPSLLTKYLDAARQLSSHAVLTPSGIRFSKSTSQRDWTDESLARIREFYARYSSTGGATPVNLQGIRFDTNAGGRLPLEKYLSVLTQERAGLASGARSLADVARQHELNARYLGLLWQTLQLPLETPAARKANAANASLLLDSLRGKWRAGTLTSADVEAWQRSLWRFASVGHIGKKGGPQAWQEPVTPLVSRHEMRLKLPPPAADGDVVVYLATGDAGDGADHDFAVWENPRLVAAGRPELPLRDLQTTFERSRRHQAVIVAHLAKCLAAAAEAANKSPNEAAPAPIDLPTLAQKHATSPELLAAWFELLGIGAGGETKLGPLLAKKMERSAAYDFIRGWTGADALSVLANSSDTTVETPGVMKPHSVAAHPSPKVAAVVAWRSPIAGAVRIEGVVQDAHTACGNGVAWTLEVRRGAIREHLAAGVTTAAAPAPVGKFSDVRVRPGDFVTLVVGPRDGSHICDLTAIDLVIHDGMREWNLARDVSPDILAGNPHVDRHGNADVWHFAGEPIVVDSAAPIPAGSLLAAWRRASDAAERRRLGEQIESLLESGAIEATDSPNHKLRRQLLAWQGPLMTAAARLEAANAKPPARDEARRDEARTDDAGGKTFGLDAKLFGRHPQGGSLDPNSLCHQAPAVLELRLPAELAEGAELVVSGRLAPAAKSGAANDGSVQMFLSTTKPADVSGLVPPQSAAATAGGQWTDNNLRTVHAAPVIVADGGAARRRFEAAFDDFRKMFPAALCYTRLVPVDEVVTLTLFYREDEQLRRLMLDPAETAALDQLWDELLFVSEAPLRQVDVFEQLYQFATQDANPAVFEPMRAPIAQAAAAFQLRQREVEPRQLQATLDFASRAWRRPLRAEEQAELRALYARLRAQELPHAAAVRTLLTRVLVAPAFLYRGESAAPGSRATAVNDWELAVRLSYFLWASTPDDELRSQAESGRLRDVEQLVAQARRMTRDPKVRRLATEFGCQWLQIRDVATLDEKSERHFPTFAAVRGDMQEEAERFFTDLFQENRSALSLLDADHSFWNGPLARHYGTAVEGEQWRRVDGLRKQGRGGLLGFAATLAKQSGASRTSPILRGAWLSEAVLGEKLPRPPKDVPLLPEETPAGLTERQLIERHSGDERCAGCHRRIDPFGFALEAYDAIGRLRKVDAAGRAIDSRATLPDGATLEGLDGLRDYLANRRRDEFLRQFCRKLLGYALGRGVQLSEKPLLDTMLSRLEADEQRVDAAIEAIVRSPQFREVRGRDFPTDE